jgi:hypothetical protein
LDNVHFFVAAFTDSQLQENLRWELGLGNELDPNFFVNVSLIRKKTIKSNRLILQNIFKAPFQVDYQGSHLSVYGTDSLIFGKSVRIFRIFVKKPVVCIFRLKNYNFFKI